VARCDEVVAMEHNGKPGVWVPLETSQKMQADIEEFLKIKERTSLLETRLELRADTISGLKTMLEISKQIEENANTTAITALKAQEAAIAEAAKIKNSKNPWWKHPALWTTIGVVLTVGLEVAAVKVIQVAQ